MVISTNEQWLVNYNTTSSARLCLFCFPYAGGTASVFKDWSRFLPDVEIYAIQLPGHGARLRESAFVRISPLIENLVPAILPYLIKPFALFGHSLGALIAFEVARNLRDNYGISPIHLFVSGRHAPQIKKASVYDLPNDKFLELLQTYNGTPKEVLQNSELMELLLPSIRADFEISDTYEYVPSSPLNCPISAYGGLNDPIISSTDLKAWKIHTNAAFSLQMFPGDHFFLNTYRQSLVETIGGELKNSLLK